MKHQYLKINPPLDPYLRTVLVLEDAANCEGSNLPLVTNGMPALLCEVKDGHNRVTLFGQSVPDGAWIENNSTIIFFFKPYALGTIFKLPVKTLRGKPIELGLWHAQKAMAVNMQLMHAQSTGEKVTILSHFIDTQVKVNQTDCKIILHSTDRLMQDSGADMLPHLLKELNLTERTFQRTFKKYVGVSPNEYRRICQFYFAFSQMKGGHFDKLTDIVYTNGYFDQSHFIRAFKEYTETTPNDYLKYGLNKNG